MEINKPHNDNSLGIKSQFNKQSLCNEDSGNLILVITIL